MRKPLVLYSTATWLAFTIAERYYRGRHFVWCSPCFGPDSAWSRGGKVPPTSCPSVIYHTLWDEVQAGDRHSPKIMDNRSAILKGADLKWKSGAISLEQRNDISSIVEQSVIQDFLPRVYVIPYGRVAKLAREVPVGDRAHPLSIEYIIEHLPAERFDVIELRRR